MADLMTELIPIGNSGFGYISTIIRQKRKDKTDTTLKVINIKTNKEMFTLRTKYYWGQPGSVSLTEGKTFLGFDERYYHIIINTRSGIINWGQVQSDGAVLKSDRTILKHINFYPLYIKKAPVVVPSKVPITPAVEPQITTVSPKPKIKKEVKELSWWKKIINWIIKILNQ